MTSHGLETGIISDVLLPISLAIIMFGMGMSLRRKDFTSIFTAPKGVLIGLVGQLILLPMAGATVVFLFVKYQDLSTPLALGVLVLAASPGGATSNLLTFLSRGDHALSIALTTVVSLASFITTPAVLYIATTALFGNPQLVQMDLGQLMALVLGIVGIPVVFGMWVGNTFPRFKKAADQPVRIAGVVILAVLIAGVIYENRAGFWSLAADTVPAALVLNALALIAGASLALAAGLGSAERRAVIIEVGFQNGTLAIVLAVSQLNSPQAALMPGFYSLVMFVTGGLLAWGWSSLDAARDAQKAAEPPPPGILDPLRPARGSLDVVVVPVAQSLKHEGTK